jgi:hypothetical protein
MFLKAKAEGWGSTNTNVTAQEVVVTQLNDLKRIVA